MLTGEPIKSQPEPLPRELTYLLYVIFPDELPVTIIDEKSFDAEFNVIVPSFEISPLTVKSFPEFKLRLEPDLTFK